MAAQREIDRVKSNKHVHTYTQSTIKTLHKNHVLDCNILPIKSINNLFRPIYDEIVQEYTEKYKVKNK